MAGPDTDNDIQIAINEVPSNSTASLSPVPIVWHPLEHLNGHVAIHCTREINIEKIVIHLQGHSRVWIQRLREDGDLRTEVSSYKFLHQSYDTVGIQCHKDVATETSACIADFSLLIPRYAILKGNYVPDQCLNLPPSISLEESYKVPGEQWKYGQPNIEYLLVTQVTFRRRTQFPGQLPQSEVLSASRPVKIIPCSVPSPPTDLSDFPAEFVSSRSNIYKALFSGTWYTLILSTREPNAVVIQPPANSAVIIPIKVKMDTVTRMGNKATITELPSKLKDLTFKVQPVLRAKTFYSTVPFRKMPGQTMLTLKGTLRLKDEVLKLTAHSLRASSWEHGLGGSQSGSTTISSDDSRRGSSPEMPTAWSATINVPITMGNNLVPTFCSATAARQYSLIMRIKVVGWKIDDYVLEIPIQIVHAQRHGLGNGGPTIDGQPPGYEPTAALMEAWRVPPANDDETIPSYS